MPKKKRKDADSLEVSVLCKYLIVYLSVNRPQNKTMKQNSKEKLHFLLFSF